MYHYTHLTPFEREKILFFLTDGKSVTEIVHLLSRNKSTISRELRRNTAPAGQPMSYCPLTAQTLYKRRREACRPHKRLEYAPLHSYIQICILEYHWSPEEIVGRIQLEHGCRLVSVPTIYRAIHAGLLNPPGASAKFVYISSKAVVFSYSDMPQSPCSCGSSKKGQILPWQTKRSFCFCIVKILSLCLSFYYSMLFFAKE